MVRYGIDILDDALTHNETNVYSELRTCFEHPILSMKEQSFIKDVFLDSQKSLNEFKLNFNNNIKYMVSTCNRLELEEELQIQARIEEEERLERDRLAKIKAKEEADRKVKEEADRKVKEEAERKVKEEANRKAKEAERKAKEEAERKIKEEAERKVKEEAERKVKEAELKAKEEAERKIKEEAERKVKEAERIEEEKLKLKNAVTEAGVRNKILAAVESRSQSQLSMPESDINKSNETNVWIKPSSYVSKNVLDKYSNAIELVKKVKLEDRPKMKDKPFKMKFMKFKMKVTPRVGQLTHDIAKIEEVALAIDEQLKTLSDNESLLRVGLDFVSKKIINQAEVEVAVTTPASIPLAALVVLLIKRWPLLSELILGRFVKKCHYIIPQYPARLNTDTDDSYLKRLKYKQIRGDDDELKWETEEQYNERITDDAWGWIARLGNQDPRSISPLLLFRFLEICGGKMQKTYGKQFVKLINYFKKNSSSGWFEKIPKNAGPVKTRLELYIDEHSSSNDLTFFRDFKTLGDIPPELKKLITNF